MGNYFTTTTQLLVDTSARALLLAALAAIVLCFWPAGNANFRHRAWTAVLWGMLLLPILAQFTPALALLPSGWTWEPRAVIAQSSAAPEGTIPAEPSISAQAAPSDRTGEPSRATALGAWAASPRVQPPDVARGASDRDHAAGRIAASGAPADGLAIDSREHRAQAMPETSALGWTGVIAALYLCGVALLAIRLVLGYWAARRLVRRAADIPGPPNCRARLAVSEAVRVPVTVGLLRPVILLPADWSRWSPALLSSVVAHEQAHVDRRDHLVLLASEVNRCLYWFHPVAWFLRRRLSALAEQCCDDAVIAAMQSRGDYARHLLEIAARLTTSPQRIVPLGISMARGSRVESRIVAILDERRPLAGQIGRGGALALAAVVGPIVLLAAGLRAADPPPQKQQAAAAELAPAATVEVQAQAEPEKPPVKGALLSGCVDRASDGSAAVGAEVRLLLNKADWNRVGVRRTKTDEQGNFAFEDVPAGSHFLVAVLDSLASFRKVEQMTVAKIAADSPPEPVQLKLWPAPTIAVHVTSKADGAPVAGARVRLQYIQWEEQTDAEGNVVLHGLTPEVWRVEVQAAGFAEETVPMKLEGDQRAELNFALEPGGKIHGKVIDQSGKPLAGLQVDVRFKNDPYPLEGTQTDAEGRYHFDFLPLSQELEVASGREQYTRTRRTTMVPGGGDRDIEIDLVLERRPVGGSVQGLITDGTGKPIAGAALTNRGSSTRDVHETLTNAAGRFTIDNLFTSGTGTVVVVRAKGFAPQAVSVAPGPADDPTEIAVKLEPGHRIHGQVLDAAGKPIAGVEVAFGPRGRFNPDNIGGHTTTDAEGRFEFDSLPIDCPFRFELKGYSPLEQQTLALDGEQEVTVTLQPQGVVRGRVVNAATGAPVTGFRVRIYYSPDREPGDPNGVLKGARVTKGEQFESADGRFVLDDLMVGLPLEVTVKAENYEVTTLRRVLPRPAVDDEVVEFKLQPTVVVDK